MNNETDVSIKFSNKITNDKQLKEYAETLKTIKAVLGGIETGKAGELDSAAKNIKNLKNDAKEAAKNFNLAFSYTTLRTFNRILTSTVRTMSRMVTKSSEYAENINLYQVAFDGATKEADKFINKLTEMYGLDESWLTRTVGIFKQLSNAMGLSVEQGTKLATLLTQMSIDVSSLYNIDVDKASTVLQSALAGQTKPIRGATGADITVPTLQTTLDTLGIQRYASELSYAEKRLLIIISLTKQLSQATNDFGKTIESPANQMRILNEQWERLSRAVGNVFMPIIAKVLPILNGIIMALVEIINLIAGLFGYDIKDYDYGVSAVADSVLDLEDNLDGAADSAKKLRSGLRGFDKLNVITTPSDSGKDGGGGIDPAIMDAFNNAFDEYNSKLKDVQMKATKIRDSIMEWLGFTKEINKETGKVSFKFDHITSGTVLGALAAGGTIYSGVVMISKVLSKIGIISKPLPGIFTLLWTAVKGIGKALSLILTALKGIVIAISTATGLSVGWVVAIGAAIVAAIAMIVVFRDEIFGFLSKLWEGFTTYIVTPVVEFFTGLASFIYDNVIAPVISFFEPIVNAIATIFSTIIKNIADIVIGVTKAAITIILKIGEILIKVVEVFVAILKAFNEYIVKPMWDNFIKPFFKGVYDLIIKPLINTLKEAGVWFFDFVITPIWNSFLWIWDKIVWIKDQIVNIFKVIAITVADFISGMIKGVINGIFAAIEGAINFFIGMLNGAIDILNAVPGVNIKPVSKLSIPRLKVGLDFVPNDYYPAYLDYGERVLTKEENRDYTAHLQGLDKNSNNSPINITIIQKVGDEELSNRVINNLQDMATTNGKPIVIGG